MFLPKIGTSRERESLVFLCEKDLVLMLFFDRGAGHIRYLPGILESFSTIAQYIFGINS